MIPQHRTLKRLQRRLTRIEKREREAITARDAAKATYWGILAGETWGRMQDLARDAGLEYVLPKARGPVVDNKGKLFSYFLK